MATQYTKERILGRSVRLLAMAALGTRSAGVSGINNNPQHPRKLCLVFDEGAQLKEGPTRHFSSLLLAKPCPGSDPLQLFKGNAFAGVFSLGNELLADGVVHVSAKPPLFTADLFELAPDLLRALALALRFGRGPLQGLAMGLILMTDVFDGVSATLGATFNFSHP